MHAIASSYFAKRTVPCEARRNMRLATLSACWGAIPQVMVKDSGIVVIFAALIGASEMVSVMSTALLDLAICLRCCRGQH